MTKAEELNLILYEEIAFGIDQGAPPKETVKRIKLRLADMGCGFKTHKEIPIVEATTPDGHFLMKMDIEGFEPIEIE